MTTLLTLILIAAGLVILGIALNWLEELWIEWTRK